MQNPNKKDNHKTRRIVGQISGFILFACGVFFVSLWEPTLGLMAERNIEPTTKGWITVCGIAILFIGTGLFVIIKNTKWKRVS